MVNRCDDCIHSKVCIYKQKYQENYTDLENKLKDNEYFSAELNCKEYQHHTITEIRNIKDYEVGISPLKTSVSCEGCSIYEDIKRGKTIISDACTFCSKSPMKTGC